MQRTISVEGIGDVVVSKRRNCNSMRLTVHPEKGVHLSIPFRVSYADAERFVFEHRDWIAKTLQAQEQKGVKRLFTPQSHFTCRSTRLQFSPTNAQQRILSARITDHIVTIYYNPQLVDFSLDAVQNFIKKVILASMQKEAEKILFPRVNEISARTGLTFRKVSPLGHVQFAKRHNIVLPSIASARPPCRFRHSPRTLPHCSQEPWSEVSCLA